MKKLIDALANSLAKITKKEEEEQRPAGFEMISAQNEPEPKAMFYANEDIHMYDPHQGALISDETSIGPTFYKIEDIRYDEEDSVFRYLLEGQEDWVSEDWLSLPSTTKFKKSMLPRVETDEVTPEVAEAELKIMHKAMDNIAKEAEIDRLLDVIHHGSPKEVSDAKQRLGDLL